MTPSRQTRSLRFTLSAMVLIASGVFLANQAHGQDTDPLGNPINGKQAGKKSQDPKPDSPPTTESENDRTTKSGKDGKPSDLPTLPESMRGAAKNLRSYQPERDQAAGLPTTRNFLQEGTTASAPSLLSASPAQESDSTNDPAIQTQSADGELRPAEHGQFQLVKRSTQRWVFGLEMTASGGLAGAVGSAPLPIEWEEQKIRIVRSFKTPNVGRVTIKKFPGQGRQMIVSVPRLAAGESASATVTMELDRYDIVNPAETQSLQLPEKGNRSARLYLGTSPYIETHHKRITQLAEEIVDPNAAPWDQALAIYDWVQQNIRYQFDPQIHSCLEALDAKQGDCEEVASLFIALCRNRGIPARAVWCNDHTYPEFMLCTPDGKDVWFPCQITTTQHMFGVMYDDRPILQKGDKFSILGEVAPYRYLKPAMTAKRATGAPTFRWIIEKEDPDAGPAPGQSPLDNGR